MDGLAATLPVQAAAQLRALLDSEAAPLAVLDASGPPEATLAAARRVLGL